MILTCGNFFCGVSLILRFFLNRTVQETSKPTASSSDLSAAYMYADDNEGPENVEMYLEHPSPLTSPREASIKAPHTFAQMMGGLHFMATCKILRCIIKRKDIPEKVISKSLLIKRKHMVTTN